MFDFLNNGFELVESDPEINSYELVGLYALRFFWKDGHSDGLYPFKLLISLSDKK